MQLMISGGGSGGHVYPALAVIQAFKSPPQILWVGSDSGMEGALIKRANIPFKGISAAGLRGKNPLALMTGLFKLGRGYLQSRTLLNNYQPDVLFVTGGYVCAPVTLAAYHLGIPILIYLPDIQPGQAIHFLSRYATKIAVTAPPSQAFFKTGLTVVTGYPVRADLYQVEPTAAKTRLGLDPQRPVILVFGGSQGARSINKAITQAEVLKIFLTQAQLIHISGNWDKDWTQDIYQALPPALQQHYHLYPYLHQEMVDAFAAADLIVSRAGASILGEAPAVGVPAILVPYPYSGAHQWPNAQYMSNQGAAVVVADEALTTSLVDTILTLLNNPKQRTQMAEAARRLARPEAALAITEELQELSHGRRNKH